MEVNIHTRSLINWAVWECKQVDLKLIPLVHERARVWNRPRVLPALEQLSIHHAVQTLGSPSKYVFLHHQRAARKYFNFQTRT